VERAMAELVAKVATATVTTNIPDAEITIDELSLGDQGARSRRRRSCGDPVLPRSRVTPRTGDAHAARDPGARRSRPPSTRATGRGPPGGTSRCRTSTRGSSPTGLSHLDRLGSRRDARRRGHGHRSRCAGRVAQSRPRRRRPRHLGLCDPFRSWNDRRARARERHPHGLRRGGRRRDALRYDRVQAARRSLFELDGERQPGRRPRHGLPFGGVLNGAVSRYAPTRDRHGRHGRS
jgi:hypothetical protein